MAVFGRNEEKNASVLEETPEDWDGIVEVQLSAVFLLSKHAARSMAARKRGKIINLGSMYSYFGSGLVPSYAAAKGAVIQLTRSMAIERTPAGRWGEPEEVAGVARPGAIPPSGPRARRGW